MRQLGSQDRFLFFVRGGLAWVRSGLADVTNEPAGTNTPVEVPTPRVPATGPPDSRGSILCDGGRPRERP